MIILEKDAGVLTGKEIEQELGLRLGLSFINFKGNRKVVAGLVTIYEKTESGVRDYSDGEYLLCCYLASRGYMSSIVVENRRVCFGLLGVDSFWKWVLKVKDNVNLGNS